MLGRPVFTSLPSGLGFHGEPLWWPLLPLTLAGLPVGLTIRYLPGKGGHAVDQDVTGSFNARKSHSARDRAGQRRSSCGTDLI